MQRKVPFFILFSPFNSGLAAISSASLMPYSRLMLNTVSFRFTLCMSRQRDSMGPGILLLATTVLLLSVSVGAMVSASVVEGMTDDLSDTEILGAQSRVGVTDGFGRYIVFHGQSVKGLTGFDGMVCFFLCVGGTAGDTQRASDEYFLVTAGVQFDDVRLADAVHAGDGVETLSFFDGMQEIRLILLCYCTDTCMHWQAAGSR